MPYYCIKNGMDLGGHFGWDRFKKLKRRNGLLLIVIDRTLEEVNQPRPADLLGGGLLCLGLVVRSVGVLPMPLVVQPLHRSAPSF